MMETIGDKTAAIKKRVADRAKKAKENIARLSAQGKRRRRLAGAAATIAPGFGGHSDRGGGEDSADGDRADIGTGALIPDPDVFHDIGITAMTAWRWDRDPRMAGLGWPPPIYRGRYKFRDSNQYQKFKANLVRQAIAKRNTLLQKRTEELTA